MWSVKLDLISQAFGKADAIFFYKISHFCRPLFWQRCFLCSTQLILNSANIYLQERPTLRISTTLSCIFKQLCYLYNTSVEVASWNRMCLARRNVTPSIAVLLEWVQCNFVHVNICRWALSRMQIIPLPTWAWKRGRRTSSDPRKVDIQRFTEALKCAVIVMTSAEHARQMCSDCNM